jgi:HK97 family phage prohead protease
MKDLLRNLQLSTVWREASVTRAEPGEGGEDNVFTACYSTGAAVRRWNWDYGDFLEVLSVEKGHVRTGRLDSGALPILLDHEQGVRNTFGVVEKHWIEDGKGFVQFRMETGTPDADAVLNKVRQGIVKNVSVGYRIHSLTETKDGDRIPTLTATDWEPFEISLVSVPADAGATVVRSDGDAGAYPCNLITTRTNSDGEEDMKIKKIVDGVEVEVTVADDSAEAVRAAAEAAQTVDAQAIATRAVEADRARQTAIRALGRKFDIDGETVDDMAARGLTVEQANSRVLELLAERSQATKTASVRVGQSFDDPAVVTRAFEDSLVAKVSGVRAVDGKANEFMGASMLESYAKLLVARGEKPIFNREELATRALHTTSDFPVMLSTAMHRVMQEDYAAAPASYRLISEQNNFLDFRDQEYLRGTEFPALKDLGEGGEIQSATFGDGKLEKTKVGTKAVLIAFTRELLINDSVGYLQKHIGKLGRRIAASENKAAWDLIGSNPKMNYDGKTAFHADHGNLAASAVASPDEAVLSAIRAALMSRTSDGIPLSFMLKYLIVDPSLLTAAEKLRSAIQATATGDVNVFAGKFDIIADQNVASHNAWYGAVDKADAPVLTHGYLGGNEGPMVDTKEGWNRLAMELRVVHDFGVGLIGDQGIYKVKKS